MVTTQQSHFNCTDFIDSGTAFTDSGWVTLLLSWIKVEVQMQLNAASLHSDVSSDFVNKEVTRG